MKDCLNCANYAPRKDTIGIRRWNCKSMTAPMDNYKCHMNPAEATKAEMDIAKYTIRHTSVARREQ